MKILYSQPQLSEDSAKSPPQFEKYGIENCYLKQIFLDCDDKDVSKKQHSHTSYEIHMVVNGSQKYKTADGIFEIGKGQLLIIPPNKQHKIISTNYPMHKFALEFKVNDSSPLRFDQLKCTFEPILSRILDNINRILSERKLSFSSSEILIESLVFESIILLLRSAGAKEDVSQTDDSADIRIAFAKQYIKDNIESPLLVSDIAAYCYISEKQLTRLFNKFEGISPSTYIKKEKIKRIELLLSDDSLSLKDISERMCFSNEYYFNVFFKKYYGMPPGQYRKMFR